MYGVEISSGKIPNFTSKSAIQEITTALYWAQSHFSVDYSLFFRQICAKFRFYLFEPSLFAAQKLLNDYRK